jgi:hypothetical protein
MIKYNNLSGKSDVSHYEIVGDEIRVKFKTNSRHFIYNSQKPGKAHVEKMIELAEAGQGLGTYIAQHVKKKHFSH